MTFLYCRASRCTSGDCKLFCSSPNSPFLFDSLKYDTEAVDILNFANQLHGFTCASNIVLLQFSSNLSHISKQADDKVTFYKFFSAVDIAVNGQNGRTKRNTPWRQAPCLPAFTFPAKGITVNCTWSKTCGIVFGFNLPRSNKKAGLPKEKQHGGFHHVHFNFSPNIFLIIECRPSQSLNGSELMMNPYDIPF